MRRPFVLLAGLAFLALTPGAFSRRLPGTPDKPAVAQEKSSANVTICFYRMPSYYGAPYKPSVYVGKTEIGRLRNGEAIQVTVPPGMHRLYSNDTSSVIELNAQPGQTYYVRVDMKRGVWKYRGALTLVDGQQGKGQFAKQPLDLTRDLSAQSAPSAFVRATKYPAT